MGDRDDGMSDMAMSYQRYLNAMLDTSRTDFGDEDSANSSVMDTSTVMSTGKYSSIYQVEGMVDPAKASSFYKVKKKEVLEAKKQSEQKPSWRRSRQSGTDRCGSCSRSCCL